MYAQEQGKFKFVQGTHYEFQMSAGTLINNFYLSKDSSNERERIKKLVSIFSFSRNAFLIMDSYAV